MLKGIKCLELICKFKDISQFRRKNAVSITSVGEFQLGRTHFTGCFGIMKI